MLFVAVCCLALSPLFAQTPADHTPNALQPGIVLEKVKENSEAARAGMEQGDILLRWVRGDAGGELVSPFDLSLIEIEQGTRGPVTLEGLRGAEQHTWSLGWDVWGITARPNFQGSLLRLYQNGRQLSISGQLTEALAGPWQELLAETRKSQVSWLGPWVLFHGAGLLAEEHQLKESDDWFRQATELNARANGRIAALLFQAWGESFRQRSDWNSAAKCYQQAVEAARNSGGEDLVVAGNLNNLGRSATKRGDLSEAEKDHLQALTIARKIAPNSPAEAAGFNGLGVVFYRRGDLPTAKKYQSQALAIRERLVPGSLAVAASYSNLALVCWQEGDLDKAEEYQRQDLAITSKLAPESLDLAASLTNLGFISWQRGNLDKSEEFQHQALAIEERFAPGSSAVGYSLHGLALVAEERGNLANAEDYERSALAIREKFTPYSYEVGISLNMLGVVAHDRGDLVKAEEYYRRALSIREKVSPGSLTVADSLHNLGLIARERGNLVAAARYLREALSIREKLAPGSLDVAMSLGNLGLLARQQKDPTSKEYFRKALAIEEKQAPGSLYMARTLNNLAGFALDQGDTAAAEQSYRRALAITEALAPASLDHAEILSGLAFTLAREQRLDAAAKLYEQSLKVLEAQTARLGGAEEIRVDFRARYTTHYREYVDLLLAQNKPELAFEILERSRARSLLETLTTAHVDIHKDADPELMAKERLLQAEMRSKSDRRVRLVSDTHTSEQIRAVEKEISELTAEYQDIEAQIRSRSPVYAALTQPEPLNTREIQQQVLDPETLLLEYSLGEERSHVFIVSANSIEAFELPKRAAIETAARRVYDLLTARNRRLRGETDSGRRQRLIQAETELRKAMAQLSALVLGPIASRLDNKRLLIVSDGGLHYVPFAALPIAVPGAAPAPLVRDHEIINLPSASVLAILRRQERRRNPGAKMVAVLADPVFDSRDIRVNSRVRRETASALGEAIDKQSAEEQSRAFAHLTRSAADFGRTRAGEIYLPRLQFSRREADEIAAIAPAEQTLQALDFNASRATATSPNLANYRIIHFATHALLDAKHPELSGLVLSLVNQHGKPQNGFLDLQDIYNLDLPVGLVVLSACETALGKSIEGEGLVGLMRGFMYAGANQVVAALWSIDDEATAALMGRFYRAMLAQGMRPAAALRAAQLHISKQRRWNSPYFWASFQIQGDWKGSW